MTGIIYAKYYFCKSNTTKNGKYNLISCVRNEEIILNFLQINKIKLMYILFFSCYSNLFLDSIALH